MHTSGQAHHWTGSSKKMWETIEIHRQTLDTSPNYHRDSWEIMGNHGKPKKSLMSHSKLEKFVVFQQCLLTFANIIPSIMSILIIVIGVKRNLGLRRVLMRHCLSVIVQSTLLVQLPDCCRRKGDSSATLAIRLYMLSSIRINKDTKTEFNAP